MISRRVSGAAFIIAALLAGLGSLLIWQGSAIPDKGGPTEQVLANAGFTPDQIERLRTCGVI